ncbi:hypothetical protein CA2015_0342 [Cyclobacterium amurskyense]|uniref:Uncharacterized protein n=1 Tax=Cyclobacterium amurskyense TaxID=320787 RepID=A0A0H4P5V6_9BACT|nr:hypothetical protein CA2015_0342 [Cyclobacterium amurskyense]
MSRINIWPEIIPLTSGFSIISPYAIIARSISTMIILLPNLIITYSTILYFLLDLRYYLIELLNFNVIDNKYAINYPMKFFYNY